MNYSTKTAIQEFKVTLEALANANTGENPTQIEIDSLVNAVSAALYTLNRRIPTKDVTPSYVVPGFFPQRIQGPTKKVVVQTSEFLHTTIKTSCAVRKVPMNNDILSLLESHYLG